MQGFFTKKQTQSKTRPNGKVLSCSACGLHRNCESPRMTEYGGFKKGILNIGEAPTEVDDVKGLPFQGKQGRLLERTYKKLGVDLFEDCLNVYACHCLPTDDGKVRNAKPNEIECCRKNTLQIIEKYHPKVVVLFGHAAIYSVIGNHWKKDLVGSAKSKYGSVFKWRGFTIPDQEYKTWICPIFSPSHVEQMEGGVEETIWKQDLRQAVEMLNVNFPVHVEPTIEIIEDLEELNNIVFETKQFGQIKANVPSNKTIAFDYETTGKKPHAQGHKIICASVADSENHVYAFMLPEERSKRKPFVKILADPMVRKIAHNMKFEETWSKVKLRQSVAGWETDTMQMAHILDNRRGVSGLKFQTYVNFGIADYSSEIEPWLMSVDPKDGNSLNRIEELLTKAGGKGKLLKYCALDSIYEYRLSKLQKISINQNG